ncbi:hypothetical protein SAMN05216327_10920 [Dyadobacter sp. SG02]|nr:hypothetical protein SAMN05216327_10920 [Dyadobacter sp. SG02]
MKEENPSAENPQKLLNLTSKPSKRWAAGVPAVVAALTDLVEEGIPLRGLRALSKMNQKGGFDCPSCAWPDPDDERSAIGEYCENGAKALAEEATSKKLTARFLAGRHFPGDAACFQNPQFLEVILFCQVVPAVLRVYKTFVLHAVSFFRRISQLFEKCSSFA